jgi:hypothetical protein
MSTMGDLLRYVDTQALGFVGKKAALPFRLAADEDLTQWFKTNILDNTDLTVSDSAFNVTLPTGGITTNGRLGKCELCEEFITEHRQLDIAHKTAEVEVAKEKAAQAKFETARREARLKADNLDVFESSAPPTP